MKPYLIEYREQETRAWYCLPRLEWAQSENEAVSMARKKHVNKETAYRATEQIWPATKTSAVQQLA